MLRGDRGVARRRRGAHGDQRPSGLAMGRAGGRQLAAHRERGRGEPSAGRLLPDRRPHRLSGPQAAEGAERSDRLVNAGLTGWRYDRGVPPPQGDSLGTRIRRLRRERGVSLAKIGGEDFTRAFLSQVELGRAQPSLRVLRVIADRLGTHVDYLLEGRSPEVDRELAVERARILLLRGEAKRALISLRGLDEAAWPIGTDARLTEAEALAELGQHERARKILDAERMVISKHRDNPRMDRWRALSQGKRLSYGNGDARAAAETHLQIAERATRAGRPKDALEHYRSARTLLEA